jgi:hypothetical protein
LIGFWKKGPPDAVPEAGFIGGFEGLLFGLLLFVVGTLFVTHAWAVVDTKAATEAAARQAARTYVEASSPAAAASAAQQAAEAALSGYGRAPGRADVRLAAGNVRALPANHHRSLVSGAPPDTSLARTSRFR